MTAASPLVQQLIQDPIGQYPSSTVACFDPTTGDLPRRRLDHDRTKQFLQALIKVGKEFREGDGDEFPVGFGSQALLIGASTGQAHLRTAAELEEWFQVAAEIDWDGVYKVALLRPEDGIDANNRLLDLLARLEYAVVFARPGNNLGAKPSDEQIVANMQPIVEGAAERGLAVGLYSISDVSGCPMSPDAAAELVAGHGGDNVVAIKVTEANYENSTLRFLDDPRLAHLKIVQGWDPHLARALQDGPRHDLQRRQRCGFTSGAMSFAALSFFDMLVNSVHDEWPDLERTQASVTKVFSAMQDDPTKFADLQRAKVVMGLGQPITRDVTAEQIERVFTALDGLTASNQKLFMLSSLRLMPDGPYHDRLKKLLDDCLQAMK